MAVISITQLSFVLLIMSGCNTHEPLDRAIASEEQPGNLSFLFTRMSGKSFDYKPGLYNRNKTVAFYIDKENGVYRDSVITSALSAKGILATDSSQLKTVILIYSNTLPLDRLINKKGKLHSSGFHICYIDLSSFAIKKMVSIDSLPSVINYRDTIARKIIETF